MESCGIPYLILNRISYALCEKNTLDSSANCSHAIVIVNYLESGIKFK